MSQFLHLSSFVKIEYFARINFLPIVNLDKQQKLNTDIVNSLDSFHLELMLFMGKIAEKAVCRSVFLTVYFLSVLFF